MPPVSSDGPSPSSPSEQPPMILERRNLLPSTRLTFSTNRHHSCPARLSPAKAGCRCAALSCRNVRRTGRHFDPFWRASFVSITSRQSNNSPSLLRSAPSLFSQGVFNERPEQSMLSIRPKPLPAPRQSRTSGRFGPVIFAVSRPIAGGEGCDAGNRRLRVVLRAGQAWVVDAATASWL